MHFSLKMKHWYNKRHDQLIIDWTWVEKSLWPESFPWIRAVAHIIIVFMIGHVWLYMPIIIGLVLIYLIIIINLESQIIVRLDFSWFKIHVQFLLKKESQSICKPWKITWEQIRVILRANSIKIWHMFYHKLGMSSSYLTWNAPCEGIYV